MEARFSAFLEGELPEKETASFDAHLKACPTCEAGFGRFQKALKALWSYSARPVSESFLDSVNRAALAREAIGQTAAAEKENKRRGFFLILGWGAAAAAAAAALLIYLWQPGPMLVKVPVPVQESYLEVVGADTIIKQEGFFEVIRENTTIKVAAGESFVFKKGDVIRIGPAKGFYPLAKATPKRETTRPEPIPHPSQRDMLKPAFLRHERFGRQIPAPAVALVWEPNGALSLETAGPDHEVIPELLGLLDSDDPQIRAAAQGRLESIQNRLHREHGIHAPREPVPVKESPGGLEAIKKIFQGEKIEEPAQESPPSELWQKWWTANQESILCYAGKLRT